MDQYNVIDITTDIDSLENDMRNWSLLTYDQRKRANDECRSRYGCTNQELYNSLKAKLMENDPVNDDEYTLENYLLQNRSILIEASLEMDFDKEKYPKGYTKNGYINDNLDKIKAAKEILNGEDDDIVIINDFIDDYHMDYDLEELERMYRKHRGNIYDHKIRSDYYSVQIWGKNVDSMYTYMKAKILNMIDPVSKSDGIELSATDKELNNYKMDLQKAEDEKDRLRILRQKAYSRIGSNNLSLYEQTVLEGYFDKIKVLGHTYRQGMPGVVPFLTYDEYVNNPNCLDQRKILSTVDPFSYVLNWKDKEHKVKEEILEAYRNNDTETLLGLGWNPIVEPTEENFAYAREKQIKWMDEHCAIEITDLSDYETNLSQEDMLRSIQEVENRGLGLAPIFLLAIKGPIQAEGYEMRLNDFWGRPIFNHVGGRLSYNDRVWCSPAISFDPKMKEIYYYTNISDNMVNVMTKEDLKSYAGTNKNADIGVFVIFVPLDIRKKIKQSVIDFYTYNDSVRYKHKNYVDLVKNSPKVISINIEYLLGQFINSIFLISDIDLKYTIDRYTKAIETEYTSDKAHVIMLYYGKQINYTSTKIENNTNALMAFNDYRDLTLFKDGLNLNKDGNNLKVKLLESAYIKAIGDPELNEILKEIRDICKAKDFTKTANNYYTEEYYINKVSSINEQLSEAGFIEADKIQHLINELYKIKGTLLENKYKLSEDGISLIETITNICDKYHGLIKEE